MVRITKLKLHRTISDIMKKGNLDTLTTKKIRQLCERKYNLDLTNRRKEIETIILAFVKKKSKEDDKDPNNQNNANDEHSSDESDSGDGDGDGEENENESGEEESGEDEEESSCSGSESCSNSECSSSESTDDESNRQVPAKSIPTQNSNNIASTSKQPVAVASTSRQPIGVASTSRQPVAVASTSKQPQPVAVASTSKQPVAVASTSKQAVENVAFNVVPAKRTIRNIVAPPKKRMTSHSMNAAADDVAAIAAAAAANVPLKKFKTDDINTKTNTAAVVPSKKLNTSNNSSANNNATASSSVNNSATASTSGTNSASANNRTEMDDLAYARQLQAEEWNFRKGTINKLFRSTPQRKTDKNAQTKKKKACPFLKKCLLSPALAEVLGTNEMSRPDIVQKMWSVVRERNLFDPSNKQFILCDEQLASIFGKKRIRLIGMMKHLKQHVKDVN